MNSNAVAIRSLNSGNRVRPLRPATGGLNSITIVAGRSLTRGGMSMNDASGNVKASIADKIHQAVSSLIETELRLNSELSTARSSIGELEQEIARLQDQLTGEQAARQRLEQIVNQIGQLLEGCNA